MKFLAHRHRKTNELTNSGVGIFLDDIFRPGEYETFTKISITNLNTDYQPPKDSTSAIE